MSINTLAEGGNPFIILAEALSLMTEAISKDDANGSERNRICRSAKLKLAFLKNPDFYHSRRKELEGKEWVRDFYLQLKQELKTLTEQKTYESLRAVGYQDCICDVVVILKEITGINVRIPPPPAPDKEKQ